MPEPNHASRLSIRKKRCLFARYVCEYRVRITDYRENGGEVHIHIVIKQLRIVLIMLLFVHDEFTLWLVLHETEVRATSRATVYASIKNKQ